MGDTTYFGHKGRVVSFDTKDQSTLTSEEQLTKAVIKYDDDPKKYVVPEQTLMPMKTYYEIIGCLSGNDAGTNVRIVHDYNCAHEFAKKAMDVEH